MSQSQASLTTSITVSVSIRENESGSDELVVTPHLPQELIDRGVSVQLQAIEGASRALARMGMQIISQNRKKQNVRVEN